MEAAAQSLSKETAWSIERVSIMNATGHFRLQIWTRTSLVFFGLSSGNMPPIPSLSKPPLENSHKIDQHANRVCPFEYLIKGHGNCDSSAMARILQNCGTPECFHPKHCARAEIAARISSDLYFSGRRKPFKSLLYPAGHSSY